MSVVCLSDTWPYLPVADEDEARSSHLLFTLNVYQYRIEKANKAGLPGGRWRPENILSRVFTIASLSLSLSLSLSYTHHRQKENVVSHPVLSALVHYVICLHFKPGDRKSKLSWMWTSQTQVRVVVLCLYMLLFVYLYIYFNRVSIRAIVIRWRCISTPAYSSDKGG